MPYPLTITASAMRAINRSAVLEIIRRESPIARTTIAERLEISLPTVMRIVDELVKDGFVRAQGDTEWSGWRRRALLEFNTDGKIVLGVDMGASKIYGALANLGGSIIDEISIPRRGRQDEESYTTLVSLIDSLLASPKLSGQPVQGIGVGVPGVTLHKEGIVKWANSLNWRDFPLGSRLANRYGLPITVDNDVNLAALGELWFGAGQNCQNMVTIAIGWGIGAGIIIDRSLYRGSREASGEVGDMVPGREFLGKNFSDFGALESVASGKGIAEQAREILKDRRSPEELENLTAEDVFEAARQGQKWAVHLIERTVDYLAIMVANLAVSFDPDIIVIGGGVAGSTDLLIGPILNRLKGTIPILPKLEASNLGLRAGVMGAITHVLHNTADFYVVHKLS